MHRLLESCVEAIRTPQSARRKRRVKLGLETLESREVPTVLIHFNPEFGAESIDPAHKGPGLTNAPVNLIFWGSYWDTSFGGSQVGGDQDKITKDVAAITGSDYFSALSQYGGNGKLTYGNNSYMDSGLPGTAPGTLVAILDAVAGEATRALNANKNNATLSRPVDTTKNTVAPIVAPIYVVITQPGYGSGSGFGGGNGTRTVGGVNNVPIVWMSTTLIKDFRGNKHIDLDNFTDAFSHELAETDVLNAWARPGAQLPAAYRQKATGLSDFECDGGRYAYRLNNGILVQAYWSDRDQSFIVPDDNSTTIDVTPQWTNLTAAGNATFLNQYAVTVRGNDVTVMPDNHAGVVINVGAQQFRFEPNRLSGLTVYGQILGSSTLTIDDRANTGPGAQASYYVNGSRVDTDTLSINEFRMTTVNLRTSTRIPSEVEVYDAPFLGRLKVDAGPTTTKVSVSLFSNSSSLLDSVLVLGNANTELDVVGPEGTYTLSDGSIVQDSRSPVSYRGIGRLAVSALGTFEIPSTMAGTVTDVYARGGHNAFLVTNDWYNMDSIHGPLNLHGTSPIYGGESYVDFYDMYSATGQTYDFTANRLTRNDIAPITFDGVYSVQLYANSELPATVNVEAVAAGGFLDVVVNDGSTIHVGQPAADGGSTLDGIVGQLQLEGYAGRAHVILDDSSDTADHDLVSQNTGNTVVLDGLAPGTLTFGTAFPLDVQVVPGTGVLTGLDEFLLLFG